MIKGSAVQTLLEEIAASCIKSGYSIATAESCTGGGIGQLLTSLPGSSQWYLGGVVSYSNDLKKHFLNVSQASLERYGAVSEQVALEMVKGVCAASNATHAIATTGIAGPDGGSDEKPVGTVCFGFIAHDQSFTETLYFDGDRNAVRQAATIHAIKKTIELLS